MSTNNRSHTITFRLPHGVCEVLDRLAAAQGISRGNWARGQVLSAISRPDKEELESVLNNLVQTNTALEKRLRELQLALVRHLYQTLTKVAAIEHSVAEAIAREKLFPEDKGSGRNSQTF